MHGVPYFILCMPLGGLACGGGKAKQNNTLVSCIPPILAKMGRTLVLYMHKKKKVFFTHKMYIVVTHKMYLK